MSASDGIAVIRADVPPRMLALVVAIKHALRRLAASEGRAIARRNARTDFARTMRALRDAVAVAYRPVRAPLTDAERERRRARRAAGRARPERRAIAAARDLVGRGYVRIDARDARLVVLADARVPIRVVPVGLSVGSDDPPTIVIANRSERTVFVPRWAVSIRPFTAARLREVKRSRALQQAAVAEATLAEMGNGGA